MRLVTSLQPGRPLHGAVPFQQRLKNTLANALYSAGFMRMSLRLLRKLDPTRRLVVLIYHKVVPGIASEAVEGVACENLESQVRVMKELFECLSADDATAALDSRSSLRDRYPLLFTFDDGYHNNLQYALPVLSAWQVPSIVFAPTALVGTQQFLWTDEITELLLQSPRSELHFRFRNFVETFRLGDRRSRLAAARTLKQRFKQMPFHDLVASIEQLRRSSDVASLRHHDGTRLLSWSSLQRLPSYGADVGSHSARHMILSNLPKDVLEADLLESQAELTRRLGKPTRYIAYPNGHAADYNEQVFTSARKTGIIYGFTMEPGIASQHDDPLQLPRIAAKDEPGASVALEVLRHLARDVVRQQLRQLWHRGEVEVSAPPRLVIVEGQGQDAEAEPSQRQSSRRPRWSSSREVGRSESNEAEIA